MDLGIIATGIAAITAFGWGRGKFLRNIVLISWIGSAFGWLAGAKMPSVVMFSTIMDFAIAGAALAISTRDHLRYDARIIGGLSMALMPAHWIMAATQGAPNWGLYAAACNATFIVQCLIVRGWMDGVGRGIGHFFGRGRDIPALRRGGR